MKTINAFELKTKIAALLRDVPELSEEDMLRLDTLDGEVDFKDAMSIILDDITSDEAMVIGIELLIKDWRSRKERLEFKIAGRRKLAKEFMDQVNLRKLVLPGGTFSVRAGQPSVQIIDSAFLPESFWRIKREPNLAAIKEALREGNEVPGACLNNSPDTLAILRK